MPYRRAFMVLPSVRAFCLCSEEKHGKSSALCSSEKEEKEEEGQAAALV
jgi:hypothetical protein